MSYKILHFADLHLDASFAGQGFPVEYGNERRLDLRSVLTRILARARELKVDAVTIGGDLFVQEFLLPETADFIQQQLALLAPIRVIIAPGGQDPYTNESPYALLNWPENVDIFYQGKLTHLELAPNLYLWGACNPLMRGYRLQDGLKPEKGINILLLHLLHERNRSEIQTISHEEIQKAGFNSALLGGKHIAEFLPPEQPLILYPGSPEPLSPSEENELHNIVVLEISDEKIQMQSLSVQQWHYSTIEVDLTKCISNVEVARRIETALKIENAKTPHSAITVTLTGQPYSDLINLGIRESIQTPAFFRLESQFGLSYDLEQLAHEQTVRGLLVQRFMDRIRNATDGAERNQQLTALNFALQALEGKQVCLYETKTN